MAKGKFSQPRNHHWDDQDPRPQPAPPAASAPEPPETTAPEPAPETSTPTIEKNKKIVLISLTSVALVLLIGLVVTVCFLIGSNGDDGLILNNVTVAGVNLGGMTREEATQALQAATGSTYTRQDMVIELPDTTLTLSPADTGAVLNIEAAIEAAYNYGRTGSSAEQEAAREQSLTGAYNIALLPYLNLDTAYIRQTLEAYCASFNSDYQDSSARLEGEMPELSGDKFDANAACQTLVLNPGTSGRHIDVDTLYNQVLDAYSFNIFLVEVDENSLGDEPEALDLDALYAEYSIEPVDAYLDTETREIVSEIYGYTFDLEYAKDLLTTAEPGIDIRIPMEYVEPEMLSAEFFSDILASYKTEHTTDENRNNNLALACASIDGTILMPGELFDYNTALGKRTVEAGYKAAAAYSGGQTVKEIGGGICQVSSTLYYCTLIADLEIVTREAHSFVSSYMPMGMDATVSWGGPDFQFRNNTENPIKIEAWVADGYVHIQLLGIDDKDYFVEMEYKLMTWDNYEVIYEEYTKDNAEGYKDGQVIQTPYNGCIVYTYKCKYDKETGELLSRDFEARSEYKRRDQIIVKIVTETEATTPSTEAPGETSPSEAPTESTPPEATTEAPTQAPTQAPTDAPAHSGAGEE